LPSANDASSSESLTFLRASIPWAEVAKRTVKEIADDNCVGLAAQMAFYFLLALFPAVLFGIALLGYVPVENALNDLLTSIGALAPPQIIEILRGQLVQVSAGKQGGLLSVGIAGAIWSSSAAMVAIIDALNHAFDVAEWRPWWKRRVIAILLTVALALFVMAALTFVLIGPTWASNIARVAGLGPAVALAWSVLRWPVMFACVVLAVDLVYYFAPNRTCRWAWITPGSVVATVLWIVSSFAFKFYVTHVTEYAATYGAIAGIIVTMLWFYVSSMAILIGAEVNGVIEQATHAGTGRRC
jgi:membrane protein